jgi:hypothetical protein
MCPRRGVTRRTKLSSGNVTDLHHLGGQGKASLCRPRMGAYIQFQLNAAACRDYRRPSDRDWSILDNWSPSESFANIASTE